MTPEELLFGPDFVDDAWLCRFRALADQDPAWLSECQEAVTRRYRSDPRARDGFSRIAWALSKEEQFSRADDFFTRDFELGRMRRWQFLRFVETLLALNYTDKAELVVERYYEDHPEAQDGWATIGRDVMDKAGSASGVVYLERDRQLGRLSSLGVLWLAEALAREGDWETAIQKVQVAYDREPGLTDGFARLGGIYADQRNWRKAADLFERDLDLQRLTPGWMVEAAIAFAALGDLRRAAKFVFAAYAKDPRLRDGFARIGGLAFWVMGDYDSALRWIIRDQQDGRLTLAWLANLSIVAAKAGDLNLALQAAQEALEDSQAYTDLYSRIAWAFHYPRGEFEDLAELCRRDIRSGRCSPEGGRLCAQALYLCGEWQEASDLVQRYYADDGSLRDWYAAMADLPDSQVEPSPEVLYDMDLRAGRLSEAAAKRYLSYLVGAEKDQQAIRLAERLTGTFSFSPEHEIALAKISLGQTGPWGQLLCRPLSPGSGQRDEVELARFLHSVIVGRSYNPSFPRKENGQLSTGEVIFEAVKQLDIC